MKKVKTRVVRKEDAVVRIKPPSRKVTIRLSPPVVAPPLPPPLPPPPPDRPNRFVSVTTFGSGVDVVLLAVDSDGRIWRQSFAYGVKNPWRLYDDTSV